MGKLSKKIIDNRLVMAKYAKNKFFSLQSKTDLGVGRFMQLLYFTCLESARAELLDAKKETRDFDINNTLFADFDNWTAHTGAVVEQNVYNNREKMNVAKIKEATGKIKMIDNCINALTNDNGKSIPISDKRILDALSKGYIFNDAKNNKNNKTMNVTNHYFLKREIELFDKLRKPLMVDNQKENNLNI